MAPLKRDAINNEINNLCKLPDKINTPFCTDIRQTIGTDTLKKNLNQYLYNNYCNLDANIGSAACSDVKLTCNDTTQLVSDIYPYNCNSLVKNLNVDSNIIMMTSKLDLTKVPATTDKTTLLNTFNKSATNAVEDALCSLTSNISDPVCQTYLANTFSALVKTNNLNPILIMYFSGTFATKMGMDSYNSSKILFRPLSTGLVGFTSTPMLMPSIWSAKLYTYITPSTTTDYVFKASADDIIKVYLNNNLIINTTGSLGSTKYSSYITLDPSKGPYLLYIEYNDLGGKAALEISYTTRALIGTGTADKSIYSNLSILPTDIPTSGTSPLTGTEIIANTLYMSPFNPYTLASTGRKTQSIKYCSTDNKFATDVNCIGTNANGYSGINSLYSTDPIFKNNMINYCGTNNNFATNPFCLGDSNLPNAYSNGINKNPITYDTTNMSINKAIADYCTLPINNTYITGASTDNLFCKNMDNLNNINYKDSTKQSLNPTYANTLRATRLEYIKNAIATSIKTGGSLTQDVIDYITTDYITLQNNAGANLYPDSNIINQDILPFCENSDPKFQTDLCKNIYANPHYKLNADILISQDRINDFANCIANNAFMGKSGTNFDAPCLAKRDAPSTYARYLPLAIQYCGTGDNIVSPECNTYYNTIQGNINNAMSVNYAKNKSSFTGSKENFDDGCNHRDDENRDNNGEDSGDNCDWYSDYGFIFIILICFILILSINTYSKCKKHKYYNEHNIKY